MHLRQILDNLSAIIAFLLIFVQLSAQAAETSNFDPAQANIQLEQIYQEMNNNKTPDIKTVRSAIYALGKIQAGSKHCEATVDKQLTNFEKLAEIGDISILSFNEQQEFKRLQARQQALKKELAECRLLLFRIDEILKTYRKIDADINKQRAFTKRKTVIEVIKDIPAITAEQLILQKTFDLNELFEFNKYAWPAYTLVLIFLLLSLVLFNYLVARHLGWLKIGRYRWPIAIFFVLTVVCQFQFWDRVSAPNIEKIVRVLLAYFTLLPVIRYLLCIKLPELLKSVNFNERYQRSLYFRAVVLLTLLAVGFIGAHTVQFESIQTEVSDILWVCYLTLLVFSFMWLYWPIIHYLKSIKYNRTIITTIEIGTLAFICSLLGPAWTGYHKLALLEVRGIVLTMLTAASTWVIIKCINYVFLHLEDVQYSPARRIHDFFDVNLYKKLFEFNLIRLSLYIVLMYFTLMALMFAWSFPNILIYHVATGFFRGYMIFEFELNLSRLITSVLIFSTLSLVTRLIVKSIAMQDQPKFKQSQQVALASIIHYCGFAMSLVVALLFAGVDFTGLAIIAGALSVGVGLGLQDIVKNFVAGIILLLEKSIKPGDRIIVGNTEGHVKKIRIRATQITTMQRSDVIVPNAEFISAQVTNYMFRKPIFRISNAVGVAYGSDIKKVADLMLQLAQEHPDVLNDKEHFPRVLFREFTECSLHFELRNFITDVNRKNIIMSDINFKIAEVFAEHHIDIAFPQLDVHIHKKPN